MSPTTRIAHWDPFFLYVMDNNCVTPVFIQDNFKYILLSFKVTDCSVGTAKQ